MRPFTIAAVVLARWLVIALAVDRWVLGHHLPAGGDKSPCAENDPNFVSLGVAPIPEAKRMDF